MIINLRGANRNEVLLELAARGVEAKVPLDSPFALSKKLETVIGYRLPGDVFLVGRYDPKVKARGTDGRPTKWVRAVVATAAANYKHVVFEGNKLDGATLDQIEATTEALPPLVILDYTGVDEAHTFELVRGMLGLDA